MIHFIMISILFMKLRVVSQMGAVLLNLARSKEQPTMGGPPYWGWSSG